MSLLEDCSQVVLSLEIHPGDVYSARVVTLRTVSDSEFCVFRTYPEDTETR
jgi:hypothetical protein